MSSPLEGGFIQTHFSAVAARPDQLWLPRPTEPFWRLKVLLQERLDKTPQRRHRGDGLNRDQSADSGSFDAQNNLLRAGGLLNEVDGDEGEQIISRWEGINS